MGSRYLVIFYATQHGRNSIDNNGMKIISTVHYCDPDFGVPTIMRSGMANKWYMGMPIVTHWRMMWWRMN